MTLYDFKTNSVDENQPLPHICHLLFIDNMAENQAEN